MKCAHCGKEDATYLASFSIKSGGIFNSQRRRRYPVGEDCILQLKNIAYDLELSSLDGEISKSVLNARVDGLEKAVSTVKTSVTRIVVVASTIAALLGIGWSFLSGYVETRTKDSIRENLPTFLASEAGKISEMAANRQIEKVFSSYLGLARFGGIGPSSQDHLIWGLIYRDKGLEMKINKALFPTSGWQSSVKIRKAIPYSEKGRSGTRFKDVSQLPTDLNQLFGTNDNGEQFYLEWPGHGTKDGIDKTGVFEVTVPGHATHIELLITTTAKSVEGTVYALAVPATWYTDNEQTLNGWNLWRLSILNDDEESTIPDSPRRAAYEPDTFVHRFFVSYSLDRPDQKYLIEIARQPKITVGKDVSFGSTETIAVVIWSSLSVPLHSFLKDLTDQSPSHQFDDPLQYLQKAPPHNAIPLLIVKLGQWQL